MKPDRMLITRFARQLSLTGMMLLVPWLVVNLLSHQEASLNVLPDKVPAVDFLGTVPVAGSGQDPLTMNFSVGRDGVYGIGNQFVAADTLENCGLKGVDGQLIWNFGEQLALDAGQHTAVFANRSRTRACQSIFYGYQWRPPIEAGLNVALSKVYEGSLVPGQVNAYKLQVAAVPLNVDVRVAPRTTLQPIIRFYDHLGRLLATGKYNAARRESLLTSLPVWQPGEYTITVQDWSFNESGNYALTVSKGRPLAVNVGEARLASLPFEGKQTWAVNVTPGDLADGPIRCVAYGASTGPALSFSGPGVDTYVADLAGIAEPGVHELSVFAVRDGGPYVFGCASIGNHDLIYVGYATPSVYRIGEGDFSKAPVHKGHHFYGDYFTRYMPAAAGSSATFRFIPTNNRKMVLKLSLGNRVIARAEGREPGFTVTFPADGVYTLVGENPAGVASDLRNVGAEEILVDWASDPAAIVSGASAAVPFPHFEGKIVFARGDAGCSTVVVRDMARNREYTASLQGDLSEPSWSPDGSRFVASAGNCNENSHSLAVFGADARFVRFITGVGNDVDPDWGSDGRIYFARGSTQGGGTLYSVKPDGTDERSLGLSGRQPALSPDGRYLAFMRKSGAVWRIAVAPTLGNGKFGRATELSLPSAASQAWMPNWTADSRRVVFDITREGFGTVVASVDAASNYLTATVLKSEWSSPLSRPSCSPSSDTCVANGDKWGDVWLVTYENGLFTVTGEVATQQRDWGADIFP